MDMNKERRFLRQWLMIIGFLLFLGGMISVYHYLDYRKTEALEQERLLVQARVVNENLSHQLRATNEALSRILQDLPYWHDGKTYLPVANLMLETIEEAMPGVRTLLIIDDKGIVLASSRRELIGLDLSGREYFQTVLRLHDPSVLYLSPPYTTVTGVFVMNVSRMVPGFGNGFGGLVVATLDPAYFKTLLASVLYSPDMWTAVAHGDGVQFLMVPHREGQAGKNLARAGSFFSRHRESGKEENILTGTVYATGESRMMAVRTIQPAKANMDKPLIVAVGRDLQAVFAVWRYNALISGSVFFCIILITIVSARYHQRSVRSAEEKEKKSQEALRKSEERYRLLAENTSDVFWQLDLKTERFTYVSPAVLQLRGFTPEEVMAQPVSASLTPESLNNVRLWMAEALGGFASGNTDAKMELRRVEQPKKDGTTVWTEVSTTYIFDERNDPVAINGISRDITERKMAEDALLESEERFRHLFERVHVISLIIEPDTGSIVDANEAAAAFYGWTRNELRAMKISDINTLSPARVQKEMDAARASVVSTSSSSIAGPMVHSGMSKYIRDRSSRGGRPSFTRLSMILQSAGRPNSGWPTLCGISRPWLKTRLSA